MATRIRNGRNTRAMEKAKLKVEKLKLLEQHDQLKARIRENNDKQRVLR